LRDFPPPFAKIPEFLATCIEMRGAIERKTLSDPSLEEAFYLIASGVETLAEEELDKLFDSQYKERLRSIRERHELKETEFWKPGDPGVPEEYNAVLDEFRAEKRSVLARLYRKYGDRKTAELVETDYAAYVSRREEGKQMLFGRDTFASMVIPRESEEGTGVNGKSPVDD